MRRERSPVTGNYQSEKGRESSDWKLPGCQRREGSPVTGNYWQSEKGRESCDWKLPG